MDAKFKQLIDANRTETIRTQILTKDQQDFLILCRHHTNPVEYNNMEKLWQQAGWGTLKANAMRRRVREIEGDKKLLSEIYKRIGL